MCPRRLEHRSDSACYRFAMSDNPYASPVAADAKQDPDKSPGLFIAVCVICLILGIFGLMGTCFTGVGFALQSFMAEVLEQQGDSTDMVFQRENLKIQQPLMLPALLISLFNLVVAGGLVIGAIGGLKRTEKLWKTFRLALFGAIFYGLLKIGLQVYGAMLQLNGFEAIRNNPNLQGNPAEMEQMLTVARYMGIATAVVGVLLAVGLIAFYAWAASYINRPHIRQLYR